VKVTVIIPTYNRYKLLKRAIKSLLAQSYRVDEIIIVDDGSVDKTSTITQEFTNIKYLCQENAGVSAARNLGIAHSSNYWIAFLDSDDEWSHAKLQEQVNFHEKNPKILMSYTAEVWIRDGVVMKIPKKFRKIGKDIFIENLSYCNIAPSSVLLHKSILDNVGMFDESLEVCEDYDLWLRILCQYKVALIDKALIKKYAGHDEQLGFRKNMDRYRICILEKLLNTTECEDRKDSIRRELIGKYGKSLKRDKTMLK
jgi:glycosyltransferase involved in cell wall biosynthesis